MFVIPPILSGSSPCRYSGDATFVPRVTKPATGSGLADEAHVDGLHLGDFAAALHAFLVVFVEVITLFVFGLDGTPPPG